MDMRGEYSDQLLSVHCAQIGHNLDRYFHSSGVERQNYQDAINCSPCFNAPKRRRVFQRRLQDLWKRGSYVHVCIKVWGLLY